MWQAIKQLIKTGRRFIFIVIIAAVLELALSGVIPHIFPETWYLKSFLKWEQLQNTQNFYQSSLMIRPDERLGWRNKENFRLGNISFDEFGSRFVEKIFEVKHKKARIIFIGDSRICGSEKISNLETINSFLESQGIETLNFGTNYYSLDQMYLLLTDAVKQLTPDVAVIGLGTKNTQLLNAIFIPFADPDIEIALIKPRFKFTGNYLALIDPNVKKFLQGLPNSIEPLAFFHRYDENYKNFEHFKKYEFTPMLGLVHFFDEKISALSKKKTEQDGGIVRKRLDNSQLANSLINSMMILAHEWNVRLFFLILPEKVEFENPDSAWALQELKKLIQLNSAQFIDGTEILKNSNLLTEKIYLNNFHFSPEANKILAEALKREIEPNLLAKSGS